MSNSDTHATLFQMDTKRAQFSLYLRNVIFGVEDSLVSTVELLAGIAYASVSHATILLTGFVLVFVEAFSMAVGSFLSEDSAQEYESQSTVSLRTPITGGVLMFFSYLLAGLIPIAPFIFIDG